ncbi:hypothetical protein GDO86_013481 [Hymenochirus boettgeri]|uniref:Fcf2 pre-rRNA processing C-terminal domain-containing protein n=1 Tax=Hymenochirus boettgeri TaxID=247094 RepID=A0A8T2IVH9_9PIPI|nr:hypothetical protein GDO86_013481 [Hymenochirus boettgeri]
MVATRSGTRVSPDHDVGDGESSKELDTLTASTNTNTEKMELESQNADSEESRKVDVEQNLQETSVQIITRSRRRSGQSDGDASEADSITSSHSTRRTRSMQSLACLTDSARKLRSHRSVVVTEPIVESREDTDLSEAESNCSSLSSTVLKRQSTRLRNRKSVLQSEMVCESKEIVEISEAESNCSSASGVLRKCNRSTRSSRSAVKCRQPPMEPSVAEEISDVESYSSDVSFLKQTKLQLEDEALGNAAATGDVQVKESSSKEEKNTTSDLVFSEKNSSEAEQRISSPRRSLRSRKISQSDVVISDAISEVIDCSSNKIGKVSDLEKEKPKDIVMSSKDDIILVSDEDGSVPPSTKTDVLDPLIRDDPQQIELYELKPNSSCFQVEMKDLDQEPVQESKTSKESTNLSEGLLDVEEEQVELGINNLLQEPVESTKPSKKLTGSINIGDKTVDYWVLEEERSKPDSPQSSTRLSEEVSISTNIPSTNQNISLFLNSDDSEDSDHSDSAEDDEMEEEAVNTECSTRSKKQPSEDFIGNGLFVIDTAPGLDPDKIYYADKKTDTMESEEEERVEEDQSDDDFIDEDGDEESELLYKPRPGLKLSTSINTGLNIKDLGGLYISFDGEKTNPAPSLLQKMKKENAKKEEILQKSVITPDFEKKESVQPYKESLNQLKKQRKAEREKTTGRGWFDMKAPEMTEEIKNDLKALKMRRAMDPKRFYKKNDREGFPKYFQVGTIVDSPLDFYTSRIPKKQRKRTIVEELLADSEFRRYNKKKYKEISAEKAAIAEGKKNRKKRKIKK